MENHASGGTADGLFDGVHVPAHLPAVLLQPPHILCVSFEIDDSPLRRFHECEINDSFDQIPRWVFGRYWEFAEHGGSLLCANQQRMLKRAGNSLRGRDDFFVCGV